MKSLLHLTGIHRRRSASPASTIFRSRAVRIWRYNFNSFGKQQGTFKSRHRFIRRLLFFCLFFFLFIFHTALYVQHKLFNFCFKSYRAYRLFGKLTCQLMEKKIYIYFITYEFIQIFINKNLIEQKLGNFCPFSMCLYIKYSRLNTLYRIIWKSRSIIFIF